jgi:alkylhydroperoxidase/carboxymuconolactone decarboxylase family protein YurZ
MYPLARMVEKRKDALPMPDYFGSTGVLADGDWVESYMALVLQWPKSCAISMRDRQLIGLAKALAFGWEPGILNHTDLALKSGCTGEQVTEVLKAASAAIGLAKLDSALSTADAAHSVSRTKATHENRVQLKPVKEFFGTVPPIYRNHLLAKDPRWLADFVTVARPSYDARDAVLKPATRALVCLAASAVLGWHQGVQAYGRAALRFGESQGNVDDVVKSIFKTAVSNAMAAGFRTPCHIPRLDKYQTILRAYVEKGALLGGGDPLTLHR